MPINNNQEAEVVETTKSVEVEDVYEKADRAVGRAEEHRNRLMYAEWSMKYGKNTEMQPVVSAAKRTIREAVGYFGNGSGLDFRGLAIDRGSPTASIGTMHEEDKGCVATCLMLANMQPNEAREALTSMRAYALARESLKAEAQAEAQNGGSRFKYSGRTIAWERAESFLGQAREEVQAQGDGFVDQVIKSCEGIESDVNEQLQQMSEMEAVIKEKEDRKERERLEEIRKAEMRATKKLAKELLDVMGQYLGAPIPLPEVGK